MVTPISLGMFGFRALPFVGRDRERDAIWQALCNVHQGGAPRVVVVRGAAGVGKSRLGAWIAERAHETDTATLFAASHSPTGGPATGLARMVANRLRCTGLDRAQISQRLQVLAGDGEDLGTLSAAEVRTLVEFVIPAADPDYGRVPDQDGASSRSIAARETHRVVGRLLREWTARRPGLLLLDDVQWGPDTLEAVAHFMDQPSGATIPLLCLMTVQEEAEREHPHTRALLQGLEARPDVDVIQLGPMPKRDHLRLISSVLDLKPSLAREVAQRSAGNPLFALELVGDWVERDILETTPQGFALRAGAEAPLPASIYHLLGRRVDFSLTSFDEERADQVRCALELGAALGHEVEYREWWRACRLARLRLANSVVETLTAHHLIHMNLSGWSFVHDALRECLIRRAREEDRWARHNLQCAQVLQELHGTESYELSQRRAHHFLEAHDWEAAREALGHTIDYGNRTGRVGAALEYCHRCHEVLDHLEYGADHPERVQTWHRQVLALGLQERIGEAQEVLRQSQKALENPACAHLVPNQAYLEAWMIHRAGDPAASQKRAKEAALGHEAANNVRGLAQTYYLLGLNASWLGEMDETRRYARRAHDYYVDIGDEHGRAKCLIALGGCESESGAHQIGIQLIKEAVSIYEDLGDPYATGVAYSNLGQAYSFVGNKQRAREVLEMGRAILLGAGLNDLSLDLNLSCALLALEEYERAEALLEQLLSALATSGRHGFLGVVYATLLPCHAANQEWSRWDESMMLAAGYLRENSIVDQDLAWTFELAADLASKAGKPWRARDAYEHALGQWRALNDAAKVAEIKALMS